MKQLVRISRIAILLCLALSIPVVASAGEKSTNQKRAKLRDSASLKSKELKSKASTSNAKVVAKKSVAPVVVAMPDVTVDDRVVASIDGEPVTISDLKPLYQLRAESGSAPFPSGGPTLRRLVDEYVNLKLVEREAQATGQSVTDEEMTAYIDEVLKQNNIDMAGFEKMLKDRGMTLQGYRAQIRGEILRSRVVGSRLRSKVAVSEGDIKKYVGDQSPQEMPEQTGFHLEQIFIPKQQELSLSGDTNQGAKEIAEGIHSRVSDGENFATVGGDHYVDLGSIETDDLIPEIRDAAHALDEDEVSDVLEGEKGFYILKRLANVEADTKSADISDDMKENVRRELTQERSKGEIDRYFGEELPKKYNVEIKL